VWRKSWKRISSPCFAQNRRHMRSKLEGHQGPPPSVPSEDSPYSYLIASPGFMLAARRRGKKITISVPTIAKTSDQLT